MEANKKASRKEAPGARDTAPAAAKTSPIKVIRVEDVSVSIFAHERGTGDGTRVRYSCSFQRSYKDAAGEWKRTQWFGLDDLGKVVACAEQAQAYLTSLTAPGAER